jgi:DNA-binding CsgD family transcriptional regulator
MADRLRDADRARWALTGRHATSETGPDSVRVGLTRAVRGGTVPVDILLTAGQLGLTAIQTELIAYLILGLSNQEIADALSVSEATVRYRLTRLYRVLDVRGRKAAAERARELGLDALVATAGPDAEASPPQGVPK